MTWPTEALGESMVRRRGSIDPRKHPDETFELFSIPAYDRGAPEILAGAAIGSAKQIVQPGDVLLSRIVPHIRRSWIVGDVGASRQIASSEWMVFRSSKLDPRYLKHVLVGNEFHAKLMQTVAGVGGSLMRARPEHVAQIRIPLPPVPEQRRIAAIIDRAERVLRLRSASIRQTDALKRSIFAAALNRCVVKQQRVSELFKTSSGSFLPAKRMKAGDVPVYGGNGVNGYHDTSNVPAGTIVIGRVGANCGAVHRTIRPAWVTDNALIVKPLKEMNPIYLEAAIAGAKLNSRASQSGQPAISYRAIEDVNLPIISIAEQNRYADQYSAIDIQSGALRDSERTLNALFASLQSRAFRGEL
ncbi:restriction endonuclease subunit S [Gordonia sp. NPDC003422]